MPPVPTALGAAAPDPNAATATGLSALAGAGGIGQVTGLAMDESASVVYAIHRAGNDFFSRSAIAGPAILAFRYDGTLVGALAKQTFVVPHGLSLDHLGFLWATDVAMHQVLKLDPTKGGRVVTTIGTRFSPGKSPTNFDKPTDVAVHAETSEVYVSDGYGNARVAVFSYDGTFLREWGSSGSGDGQFRVPHSIAIDKRGLVYVADRENARVQVFDSSGAYRAQWVSRIKAGAPTRPKGPYVRHVSSVSYHPTLDVFAVTEGEELVLRTPSGCTLAETSEHFLWPHDAVVLPSSYTSAAGTPPSDVRNAVSMQGAQYAAFIAELDGKAIRRVNSPAASQSAASSSGNGGTASLYG